jgi:hypothetical protein
MKPPCVKGFAFETTLRELSALRGAGVAHTVHDRLAPELRDGGILANGWYPLAWYRAMLGAMREVTREGPELMRLLGHRAVHTDLSTIHRTVLKLLSPKKITEIGGRYFRRVYDTGSMTVVSEDATRITARFADCAGFDRNMWLEVSGSIEGFVELAGGREVTVRITEGGRDDDPTATMVARFQT